MKERNTYLDILKGAGIILVVLAHVLKSSGGGYERVIYFFHMPLFFFISGMTLFYSIERKIKFKEFFMKKVKSIQTIVLITIISYFI